MESTAVATAPNTTSLRSLHDQSSKVRRRYRAVQSCLGCRTRKLKCDKQQPCKTCQNAGRTCILHAPSRDETTRSHITQEKDLAALNDVEVMLSSPNLAPTPISPIDQFHATEPLQDADNPEIEKVSFADAVYEDTTGEYPLDLGVQLGRMRIMERIGGYYHPKMIQELGDVLRVVQERCHIEPSQQPVSSPQIQSNPSALSFIQPGLDYLAPTPGFFFASGPNLTELSNDILNRPLCEAVLKFYWGGVHLICKCVHRTSFERHWEEFWGYVDVGLKPPAFLEAIVMAVLLCGSIATPKLILTSSFGLSKDTMTEEFKRATELALIRANFIRTTKLETLQAFVIYLVSLYRGQISKEHIVLLNLGIGIAEAMGLNRDPALYGLDSADVHVRRLLWHQLCFLDLRSCEAQKSRPQIREDEFDTLIPPPAFDLNLNFHGDANTWTDTTFSAMNFECSVIHRFVWVARPKLEKKTLDLTKVLERVIDFRKTMTSKYAFLNEDKPIQKYAKLILEVQIAKLFSMLLHRYHRAINSRLPGRLYHILIDQIILQLSNILTLETAPELSPWAWHVASWNMYRSALILLDEVSIHPEMPKADRIWRILDYIFLQPPGLTADDKSLAILTEAKDRLTVYSRLRKMRVPSGVKYMGNSKSENLESSNSDNQSKQFSSNNVLSSSTNMNTVTSNTQDTEFLLDSPFSEPIIDNIDWTSWNQMFPDEYDSGNGSQSHGIVSHELTNSTYLENET